MSAKQCPKCGGWVLGEEGRSSAPADAELCTPVRSPGCWNVVGRGTAPNRVTGHQRILRLAPAHTEEKGEGR